MVSAMMSDTFTAWITHPIVRAVYEEVGDAPLELLVRLRDVLLDLEDRFPGVPFGTMLDPPDPGSEDAARLRAELLANGASKGDVRSLVGVVPPHRSTPKDHFGEFEFQLAHADIPRRELEKQYGQHYAVAVRAIAVPLTEQDEEILALYDSGFSKARVARELGIAKYAVPRALRRRRYQEWLAEQEEVAA